VYEADKDVGLADEFGQGTDTVLDMSRDHGLIGSPVPVETPQYVCCHPGMRPVRRSSERTLIDQTPRFLDVDEQFPAVEVKLDFDSECSTCSCV
jgi:hypothetical protein